ncbi:electron transfer flavoprotein subunit alpha/FixB family protein [Corynebacterium sp. H113]|uniref:electron transfer flavoprotein subunit alpha/FixB family protein n=1 Tax=Corynebacterium sp. H113 TaxID=3133419 RepID=UPI0030B4EB3E
MTDVLVLVDHINGELKNTTAELLTAARAFGTPAAVVVGTPGTAQNMAEALGQYGAGEIIAAESDAAGKYLITPEVDVLVGLAGEREVPVVVAASATGKEIAGRVAALTGSGVLSDVIAINDDRSAQYSIFGGEFIVDGVGYGVSPVYALRPGSVDPVEAAASPAVTEVAFPEVADNAVEIVSFTPAEGGDRPELTEAKIVVSGGRGVGSAEGFSDVVEPLADALGAAVGASRAAVDAEYYPGQFQIGQTGKTVSPDLYLALGISGAIQHKAGMQTSKTIVAVNKDEEAPIFEIADLGIVGDLFKVAPQATDAIKGS